jgi:Flp pilus assembly protein TadB
VASDLETFVLYVAAVALVYISLLVALVVLVWVVALLSRNRRRDMRARNKQIMYGEFDVHSE